MIEKSVGVEIKKYDFIDSLRGFAILSVLFVHATTVVKPAAGLLHQFAIRGAMGVQLFYLASALTLFLSMDSRFFREKNKYLNFYIRRFFRIAPLFYLVILYNCITLGLRARYWAPNGLEWYDIILTIFFLNGFHPETITAVVPGGWSIAVEMMFYFFFPVVYRYSRRFSTVLFVFFIAFLMNLIVMSWIMSHLAPLYPDNQQYLVGAFRGFNFFSQFPVFVLGIFSYFFFKAAVNIESGLKKILGSILLLIFSFLYVFAVVMNFSIPHVTIYLMYGFIYCFLVAGLMLFSPVLLVNRLTIYMGKISFSVYLLHFVVIEYLRRVIGPGGMESSNGGFLLVYLVLTFFSIVLSSITYRIIELPGIRFGRSLIERLESRKKLTTNW